MKSIITSTSLGIVLYAAPNRCVDLPDEAFVVGNAAYARGTRMKKMSSIPQYIA